MNIAFIADIHGNATALEAVLADIEKKQVDQIAVLGDICFRGVDPLRSLELIRSLHAHVIKGNAEEWLVRGINAGEVPDEALEGMTQELKWSTSKLDEENMTYLKNLPTELNIEANGFRIHAFHATPDSLFDIVLPDATNQELNEKFTRPNADMCIYGHIHKPYVRYTDGKCVVNTGSVGLPFDGMDKASYALVKVEDNSITASINRVTYDVQGVISQIKKSDYPSKHTLIQLLKNAGA
ncbi:metallophosphoesterase family protein [Virgibacillus sp. W0181]|uniref:metallophosphoesterase family protein n=1 Tax=Virgibacillus sp. W0181 TaxID=3391581 RepID=UPI003F48F544